VEQSRHVHTDKKIVLEIQLSWQETLNMVLVRSMHGTHGTECKLMSQSRLGYSLFFLQGKLGLRDQLPISWIVGRLPQGVKYTARYP